MDVEYINRGQFEYDGTNVAGNSEVNISDAVPFFGLGVTFAIGRLYFDGYFQTTGSGSDSADFANAGLQESGTTTAVALDNDYDFKEQEIAFTVGYSITDTASIFAGYLNSSTDFDTKGTGISQNFTNETTDPVLLNSTQTFDYNGLFVGANQLYPIANAAGENLGIVSIKLSATLLSAESELAVENVDKVRNFKGDAVGFNVGVTWAGKLTSRLNYNLTFDSYQYNFEADSVDSADFAKSVFRYSAGISMPL